MELYRVLKPGGILIAAREHVITDDADLDRLTSTRCTGCMAGNRLLNWIDTYRP